MNIHSVGDSWTCREGDTGLDRGWQEFALPPECRHGVSGSTAQEWATDKNVMLSGVLASCESGDLVIISLVGNDMRHAADDGKITIQEIYTATASLHSVVDRFISHGCRVAMLVYTDPFGGKQIKAALGIMLMNTIIRGVALTHGCESLNSGDILTRPEHFDGKDFHPTAAGHHAIAVYIEKRWKR